MRWPECWSFSFSVIPSNEHSGLIFQICLCGTFSDFSKQNELYTTRCLFGEGNGPPTPVLLPGKSHGQRSLVGCGPWGLLSRTRVSNFPFTFHFLALEKEMATHSSVLVWRTPAMEEPGGLSAYGVAQSRIRLK